MLRFTLAPILIALVFATTASAGAHIDGPVRYQRNPDPLLLGDSLAVLPAPYMLMETAAFGGITTATGLRWALERPAHKTVYVSLGTNDDPTQVEAFRRMVVRLVRHERGGCVVWSDLYRPGGWRLNRVLRAQARRSKHFIVVRWRAAVHSGAVHLIDGVHPDEAGARARARMMLRAAHRCP